MFSFKNMLQHIAFFTIFFTSVSEAGINVIDFDESSNGRHIQNGQIIDSEYLSGFGVSVGSCNYNTRHPRIEQCNRGDIADRQVAFDTRLSHTRDSDLEFFNRHNDYQREYTPLNIGGYSGASNPGNVLIIQENGVGCGDGICDRPDDEGGRPAGFFEFSFNTLVDILSIDFFDIENAEANNFASRISFYEGNNLKTFGNVPNTGDGSFERMSFNVTGINRLVINMPGSGAIDNLVFRSHPNGPTPVNAPAAVTILLLGVALSVRRKLNIPQRLK